jgi:long-chain acyl-CoA synthetase
LPELFLHAVQLDSDRPFLLWREDDRVVPLSRPDALVRVARLAAGLRQAGIGPGDRVGILAPSSPEWLLFDLACLCAGAVVVPLFSNLSPENLAWEIGDSGSKLLLVQDEQQYSMVKGLCPAGTAITSVSQVDGIRQMDAFAVDVSDPVAWLADEERRLDPESAATIIYTSGSTGRPKGVVLSHKGLCFQVNAAQKRFPIDPATDLALSCLPLAHVFERMVAYFHLDNHYPLAISRDVQKVGDDLKVFRPTILTVVPRLLEKMLAKIEAGVQASGPVKKWIGKAALFEARQDRHILSKLAESVLDPVAWSKIRQGLGGRLRIVVSGGAPLMPELELCLSRMGIPIYQGYGMTELSPVIAVNFPGANKLGSVGFPMPGIDVRIAHDGEVLVRSPSVLLGFWNDAAARTKVVDEAGWLSTGDLGRIDPQGYLFLTGRKKDLCKTAGGKYVAPVPIEDAVASHPWIEYAVVAADDRKFVAVLLSLDHAAIRQNLALSGSLTVVTDFVSSPGFHAEIERHMQKVNQGLNEWEKVRRWIVAGQPFRIETGELTPTLKVRRSEVLVRYQSRFDALYA